MKLRSGLLGLLFAFGALGASAAVTVAQAQDAAAPIEKKLGPADIIMPHITDSRTIDYPCVRSLGEVGRPKGFAAGMEAVILYLRNEIYMPVLGGHGGSAYVPFCLTLFFFILFCNLLGLLPWGSTPTGNIAVTGTLAAITFVVVEVAGMRTLGKKYVGTIIYWPHEGHWAMKFMTIIMTPVEIVGKFTKPFALTIRLFANMIAGHVIILALIGLIFMFGFKVAIAPVAMALFIMFLEILVAFIQAFIFSLLAAVFIGQIRAAHH
jgi:F-type H+-transporting ATPase subunit a